MLESFETSAMCRHKELLNDQQGWCDSSKLTQFVRNVSHESKYLMYKAS